MNIWHRQAWHSVTVSTPMATMTVYNVPPTAWTQGSMTMNYETPDPWAPDPANTTEPGENAGEMDANTTEPGENGDPEEDDPTEPGDDEDGGEEDEEPDDDEGEPELGV